MAKLHEIFFSCFQFFLGIRAMLKKYSINIHMWRKKKKKKNIIIRGKWTWRKDINIVSKTFLFMVIVKTSIMSVLCFVNDVICFLFIYSAWDMGISLLSMPSFFFIIWRYKKALTIIQNYYYNRRHDQI